LAQGISRENRSFQRPPAKGAGSDRLRPGRGPVGFCVCSFCFEKNDEKLMRNCLIAARKRISPLSDETSAGEIRLQKAAPFAPSRAALSKCATDRDFAASHPDLGESACFGIDIASLAHFIGSA